jgi:hypothetical protein
MQLNGHTMEYCKEPKKYYTIKSMIIVVVILSQLSKPSPVQSKFPCSFCNQDHWSWECPYKTIVQALIKNKAKAAMTKKKKHQHKMLLTTWLLL